MLTTQPQTDHKLNIRPRPFARPSALHITAVRTPRGYEPTDITAEPVLCGNQPLVRIHHGSKTHYTASLYDWLIEQMNATAVPQFGTSALLTAVQVQAAIVIDATATRPETMQITATGHLGQYLDAAARKIERQGGDA